MSGSNVVRVYAVGVAYASVCTPKDVSREDIEKEVNIQHPTGVGPWKISKEKFRTGQENPHECDEKPDHLHYLLNC